MPDLIRPAARAALARWRELLIAAALAALGLTWGLTSFGLLRWLGWALVAVAAALAWTGLQRLRFARGGGGPGIVTIDERRVVYWGPTAGGLADLDRLARLDLDPEAGPGWRLVDETGATLTVPVNAEGADRLFDLFAALPGLRTADMLAALDQPPAQPVTLWRAAPPVPLPPERHLP